MGMNSAPKPRPTMATLIFLSLIVRIICSGHQGIRRTHDDGYGVKLNLLLPQVSIVNFWKQPIWMGYSEDSFASLGGKSISAHEHRIQEIHAGRETVKVVPEPRRDLILIWPRWVSMTR